MHTSHVGLRQRDITTKQTVQDARDKDNGQCACKREQQETWYGLALESRGSRTFRVCQRCRVRAAAFCHIYQIVYLERVRKSYCAKVPSTGAARSCEIALADRSHPVSVGDASAEWSVVRQRANTSYRTVLGGIVRDQRKNEAVAEDVDKDEEKDDPKLPRHCANNEVARGGSWGAVDECGYATGPQRCAARDGLLGG